MNDFLLKMRVRFIRWICKLILCNLFGGFCCLMLGGMLGILFIIGIFILLKCNSLLKVIFLKVILNIMMR